MGSISPTTPSTRFTPSVMGTRPVRIANCSGARGDPGYQFVRQLTLGDVDFITGDYLAEMNLAENAVAMEAGKHDGWEPMCWEGLEMGLEKAVERGVKVVVNGGALNPGGLARRVHGLVREKGLEGKCKVGWVEGDDLLGVVKGAVETGGGEDLLRHLDEETEEVKLVEQTKRWLKDRKGKPVVSANAYLGARGIMEGLRRGCDVIICGRVADASPVIGAAWYWWGWNEEQYDELAGSLVAGHLIECSAYVTGSNFSGFDEYESDRFVDLSFGIAEIDGDGTAVITKHESTNGLVNVDNVKCQFLYELQGSVYLNSDVTAVTDQIKIEQVGKDRVRLSNVKGFPPPPTTKLAIFYHGGYESQFLVNATGYATAEKYALFQKQLKNQLKGKGLLDKFQLLDFQVLGTPASDPRSQFSSTTYLRIFVQADEEAPIYGMLKCFSEIGMQHFSGFHREWIIRMGNMLADTDSIAGHEDCSSSTLPGILPCPILSRLAERRYCHHLARRQGRRETCRKSSLQVPKIGASRQL